MVAVLPLEHPLANQALIDLSDLKTEEFLFPPKFYDAWYFYTGMSSGQVLQPAIAYIGERAENYQIGPLSQRNRISLLMSKPISVYQYTQIRVKLVPILPHIETEIVAVYSKKGLFYPRYWSFSRIYTA